jgi:hypothetical protein
MKRSKIILLSICAIAVLAVLYFAAGVVKKRYFGAGWPSGSGESQKTETQNQTGGQSGDSQNVEPSEVLPEDTSVGGNTAPEGTHLYISSGDCDNNCKKFKANEENFKYCQEVCGEIPVVQKNSEEDCTNLSGLEKDYCWRDLAVSKKDFDICGKIGDKKLQTVCRNRVAEEILN